MPPSVIPAPEMADLVKFLRTIERRPDSEASSKTDVADHRGQDSRRGGARRGLRRRAAADRRQARAPAAPGGRSLPRGDVATDWPTYNGDPRGNRYTDDDADQQGQRRAARRRNGCSRFPARAARRSRRSSSAGSCTSPIPTSASRSMPAPAARSGATSGRDPSADRRRQPRRRGRRRSRVHGDRRRAPAGAQSVHRRAAVGYDARRLAEELLRHVGAAAGRQPGHLRRDRRRARRERIPRRARSARPARRSGDSGRCRSPASRDRRRGSGKDIEHGGAPTWFTGSYDPELDIVYWPTGNPAKEYNGDDRKGDNLYAGSILALQRATGKLKWHYQFTPHDLWDWDATQTSVLVDADWQGKPRKLMLHANRNGFFYVFDRTDGKLLLAKQFIKPLTWASGIGADGRPVKLPNQEPSPGGTKVCPSQDGATNWYSPSFNPATGLYYVQTNEKCSIYTKKDQGRLGERQDLSGRLAAHRRRSQAAADPARDRHPAPARSSGKCRSPGRPTPGAARCRPPPGWSFSARTAAG